MGIGPITDVPAAITSASKKQSLGTISGYSNQLEQTAKQAGATKKDEKSNESAWTGYFTPQGGLIGAIYKDKDLTMVKLGDTSYYDYDKNDTVDKTITQMPDGSTVDNEGKTTVTLLPPKKLDAKY